MIVATPADAGEAAYWAVVAQVVPVLALASIVELRLMMTSMAEQLRKAAPNPAGTAIRLFAFAPLLVFAWLEPVALSAVYRNESHPGARVVADTTLSVSIGALFLAPFLSALVQLQPNALAGVLARADPFPRQVAKAKREIEGLLQQLVSDGALALVEVNRSLSEVEETLRAAESLPAVPIAHLDQQRRRLLAESRDLHRRVFDRRAQVLQQVPARWRRVEAVRSRVQQLDSTSTLRNRMAREEVLSLLRKHGLDAAATASWAALPWRWSDFASEPNEGSSPLA